MREDPGQAGVFAFKSKNSKPTAAHGRIGKPMHLQRGYSM